ncbi:FtsX-like permease family protein [Lysinimonas soli]|uniref:FtsX-like permease family protein n=1 Tax=Lysinimonas soli TaxID=1074233 RepID=A0ABW0NMT7_9MICO
MRASVLVAGLSSAFGVGLLQVIGALTAVIEADPQTAGSSSLALILPIVGWVFIVIAIYVGAIVTANTFATIVAGRARSIALLRLLGSSARAQRRAVARQGLKAGLFGGVGGALVGTGMAFALARGAVAAGIVPDFSYSFIAPGLLLPIAAVVLTTWLASWIGSRRVLSVTPLQALGGSEELSREEAAHRPRRNGVAITLGALGLAALLLSVGVGLITPAAVLIGVVGGVLSFTGLVLGADVVMPPALRLVGRLFGRSAPARLAAENALRHPQRSSRATIGLVIGVTLITMFGVAVASFEQIIHDAQKAQPEVYQGTEQLLTGIVTVFSVLIGFSGLIAAVGLVNNLSLSVLQRIRELGLLRALGFSVAQIRRMILTESAQLTFSAVLLGLVLGAFYGWVGAQSMLGSINGSPGLVFPAIPWLIVAIVVGAGAALTAIASWAPTRRATRVSPITALAVE